MSQSVAFSMTGFAGIPSLSVTCIMATASWKPGSALPSSRRMFPSLTSSKQPRIENSRHPCSAPRPWIEGLIRSGYISKMKAAFARDRHWASLLPKRRKFRGVLLDCSWCHRPRDVLGLARFSILHKVLVLLKGTSVKFRGRWYQAKEIPNLPSVNCALFFCAIFQFRTYCRFSSHHLSPKTQDSRVKTKVPSHRSCRARKHTLADKGSDILSGTLTCKEDRVFLLRCVLCHLIQCSVQGSIVRHHS